MTLNISKIGLITLLAVLLLVGCKPALETFDPTGLDYSKYPVATIELESGETIKAALFPEIAPNTVNNFIKLSQSGFYDGLIFHRVIPDFMVQGGDPEGTGFGNPGYSIRGEFTDNGHSNPLNHIRGVLSMARSRDKDSAGSQFFIMQKDTSSLDGQYASFGYVFEGIEVVDDIAKVERDQNDKPLEPVVIKSIKIEFNGYEPAAVDKLE